MLLMYRVCFIKRENIYQMCLGSIEQVTWLRAWLTILTYDAFLEMGLCYSLLLLTNCTELFMKEKQWHQLISFE